MFLFSYHNGIPSPLPVELEGVNAEQLEALGYSGPFPSPSFNLRTQQAQWTGSEWLIVDLSQEQLAEADRLRLLSRANWQKLSDGLMASNVYAKVKAAASVSLAVNVGATELLGLLGDAKIGRPNIDLLNASFASIGDAIGLSDDDKAELYALFQDSGMISLLQVPNYEPPSIGVANNGEDE
jgi:hypothetical protein